MGLEGIISKRRDRPYVPGRSYDWLKVKCVQKEEFVIGGYTNPSGSRTGFGALLLGYHNGDDKLTYAGKVGTGFNDRTLADLWHRLKELEQPGSPFSNLRGKRDVTRGANWVKPNLVAQVTFGSWTDERIIRHASFDGLREDKPATDVVRDKPVAVEKAVRASAKGRSATKQGRSQKKKSSRTKSSHKHAAASRLALARVVHRDEFAGVRLTRPEKVMYPEQGITKLDLAAYYYQTADWVLPHVADRPLVLVRCPEGRHNECFYQKHPAIGTPPHLRQIPVREKSKTKNYIVVDDVAGLISLAQIGALEIHAWGSRADNIERPDRLVFDLDPDPTVPWRAWLPVRNRSVSS